MCCAGRSPHRVGGSRGFAFVLGTAEILDVLDHPDLPGAVAGGLFFDPQRDPVPDEAAQRASHEQPLRPVGAFGAGLFDAVGWNWLRRVRRVTRPRVEDGSLTTSVTTAVNTLLPCTASIGWDSGSRVDAAVISAADRTIIRRPYGCAVLIPDDRGSSESEAAATTRFRRRIPCGTTTILARKGHVARSAASRRRLALWDSQESRGGGSRCASPPGPRCPGRTGLERQAGDVPLRAGDRHAVGR